MHKESQSTTADIAISISLKILQFFPRKSNNKNLKLKILWLLAFSQQKTIEVAWVARGTDLMSLTYGFTTLKSIKILNSSWIRPLICTNPSIGVHLGGLILRQWGKVKVAWHCLILKIWENEIFNSFIFNYAISNIILLILFFFDNLS